MKRLLLMMSGLVLAALAATQCGYPSFDFTPIASGGGGTAGMGGTDASTSSSTATTSSVASTTSTGTMTMCRPGHDGEDCKPGMRCTIVDGGTGATMCEKVLSGAINQWDACADDAVCPAGTWCDYRTKVCMPFCDGNSDCGNGSCVSAIGSDGKNVPGAKVCTAFCDPVNATPCGEGATCVQDTSVLQFDCYRSGGVPIGNNCMADQDCVKGGVCSTAGCLQWCQPTGGFPSICGGFQCQEFNGGPVSYNGKNYGYCGP